MQLKKLVPSLLTCLNLLCGCVAIVSAFNNNLVWAAYLVFIAAFFDLLDGLAARALNAYSEFGKQLDSLADMVSFGLVPGVVMFKIFQYPFNGLLEGGGIGRAGQVLAAAWIGAHFRTPAAASSA